MKFDDLLGPEIIDRPFDVMIAEPVMDGKKVIEEGVYLQVLSYNSDQVRVRTNKLRSKYSRPFLKTKKDSEAWDILMLDFSADFASCAVVGWSGIDGEFDRDKVSKILRRHDSIRSMVEMKAQDDSNFTEEVKKKSKASTRKRSGSSKSRKDQA